MKCENCGHEHDGSYGSGRFCSKQCRGAFVAKGKRTGHKSNKQWKCRICGMIFSSRKQMYDHLHNFHNKRGSWNKGLTIDTDLTLKKQIETLRNGYKTGRIKSPFLDRHLTKEHKDKISNSMVKAHKEGRAHNIGESRWNNEPSYPEKWFMKVIANEFDDKNYIREYPFHRYSLDFAWIDKKKCIEIDGEQHQRFEEYKERDSKKDAKLKDEGWQILRLIWKDVFAEPKKWIQIAKEFLK